MKFNVKCLVNNVNSNVLPEAEATVKEVEVQNPNALLSSLRARAGLAFRLNLNGFSLMYKGSKTTVDLKDERKMLSECGLDDGDNILLVSKRVRDENGSEPADPTSVVGPSPTPAMVTVTGTEGESVRKAPRVEEPSLSTSSGGSSNSNDDDDKAMLPDGSEEEEEDGVDIDLSAVAVAAMLGDSADASAGALYSRLLEAVPNLVELRQEFLANPQAVMERIQREDPTLFQLITAHQSAFVELINNESVISTMQAEKDNDFYGDDEELDEEALENLMGMMVGEADDDDDDLQEEEGDDEDGAQPANFTGDPADMLGGSEEPTKERILGFAPSVEDEEKIQQLTNLGFSYDVCKLAFYMSYRSLERAANMLFESPPQL